MELKDKIAVITGGASGMGAASAKWLAARGMRIAILDRDQVAGEKLAQEISGVSLSANVTDTESVTSAINSIVARFGAIHVCINCAGICPAARIVGREGPMPLEDFQRVIQVNLVGTFNVMRLAASQMMKQNPVNPVGERGVIINTASIAAEEGQIGQSAYSASKGGVVALTLPAAREFGQFGIRVMAIAPGVFATPMVKHMPDTVTESLVTAVPFPRRLGDPDEYAMLVQQIIENAYLNGSVIRLDGAMRMGSK